MSKIKEGAAVSGRPRRVFAVSLGCAKNLVDTEVMLGALASAGWEISFDPSFADVVLVNTCGFIGDAAAESESVIAEYARMRKRKKRMRLVVAGCHAERARESLRAKFPEIDLLIGTSSYGDVVELLKFESRDAFAPRTYMHDHTNPRLLATPPWTAFLKIAEGCSNRCGYCTIPSIRGDYRSREPESLLCEAADLAALGVREMILVAQDVTRYGADIGRPDALPSLIRNLAGIAGVRWIRLMYAYPELVGPELARAIAETPRVCSYLDMPIQHADAGVLSAMNRRGGPVAIRRAIETLRDAVPEICLRTTVLVGFPGETDAQFRRLLDFMAETEFDRLGAFAYSRESGTPAAELPGQIADEVKQERLSAVMELQQGISLKKNRLLIGKNIEAVVEGVEPEKKTKGGSALVGRTWRDAPDIDGVIHIEGEAEPGDFATVRVTDADEYDLYGRIIGKERFCR
jgi:ribosomal protein S12 methylthiotransferase